MRRFATSVLSLAALAIVSISAQAPQPSFTSIAKGNVSGQQTAKQVTVRTAAEWKALWKDHSPTEKMPAVDFARDMVVGVFLHQAERRPRGGDRRRADRGERPGRRVRPEAAWPRHDGGSDSHGAVPSGVCAETPGHGPVYSYRLLANS